MPSRDGGGGRMELLDRKLQRRLLAELSDIYPRLADIGRSFEDVDQRQLEYNLFYLREHGLIELSHSDLLDGSIIVGTGSITARGIDFISDDGGLTSILGVVTVKLHEDTIKKLLIGKIEEADGDPTAKKLLVEKIKEMPSEALGTITERALESGLDQLPDLISSLSKWLGL